ncbi:Uncharacterised protein [Vibrio cholerae]|nr:Uncharacterised protein [Vibrio cholerae]
MATLKPFGSYSKFFWKIIKMMMSRSVRCYSVILKPRSDIVIA